MTTDKATLRPWSVEYVQHGKGEGNEFHAATIVDAEGNDILQSVTFYCDFCIISAPQFRHSRELIVHCVNNYDALYQLAERMAVEIEGMHSTFGPKVQDHYERASEIAKAFHQFQKDHPNEGEKE